MMAELRIIRFWRDARLRAWSVGLMLFMAAPVLAREQVTIQKSGTNPQIRAADATLIQGNPTTNTGGSGTLTVQSQSGNQNHRPVVKFDLALLPNVAIKQT